MKVSTLKIKNLKSFKEETIIHFNADFNVLVGPNGGGKSNLLDVITVLLRYFFIIGYTHNEGADASGSFKNLSRTNAFHNINEYLDKFIGNSSEDSLIEITLTLGESDINNIKTIISKLNELSSALKTYRNKPIAELTFLNLWDISLIQVNQSLTFKIINNDLQQPESKTAEHLFLQYLKFFELFLILSKDFTDVKLSPVYLYFPPYRGATAQNLQSALSTENYFDLLQAYVLSTSKSTSSLIQLATNYFGKKMRGYERKQSVSDYNKAFKEDEEVKLVSKYLGDLGYSWDLDCKDSDKNIYEIKLKKEGKEFYLNQASSGEKEILNFMLGIFAFNIKGGLIAIDEPEIHLHPKWQIVLMDLFIELSKVTNNQFILSTHSSVFINEKTISNIKRVYKNSDNVSNIIFIQESVKESHRHLLHIINSHNNEKIFFSDKVVLVEGIVDRLVFQKLLDIFLPLTKKSQVVEVLEVHGKENFDKYASFLKQFKVPYNIIADFDHINTIGSKEIKKLFEVDPKAIDKKVIKNKKSKDGSSLSEAIELAISKKDFTDLSELWDYIKSRRKQLKENLTGEERKQLNDFLDKKNSEGIHILRLGEIETYMPNPYKNLDAIIEFVKGEDVLNWITDGYNNEIEELCWIVFWVLDLDWSKKDELFATYNINTNVVP
jgi:putative ATP-dependent endonuclease of OLD family